ncbi:MAG: hypothetical protein JW720_06980 [Sedimentisphaerales bacterium]|nr:hypothetical protein [Sedimentisphaerales bacterium]
MDIDRALLDKTLEALKEELIRSRQPGGCWQGRLSSSALATAVAVFALSRVDRSKYASLIEKGVGWLAENQNADGGWGDTVRSLSNMSTTMLCWSALSVGERSGRLDEILTKAESWLGGFAGSLEPNALASAVDRQYGSDRTFSAPILTMCVLAGRLGDPEQAWRRVKPLPFELAVLPHRFFKLLRLPVVSYALPALIAIGQVNYHHRKPANPITRLVRCLSLNRSLGVLRSIQPENGGFLEATPLTAFVVMSLAAAGRKADSIVTKGVEFLLNSARDDGSWPIDTNLSTWVTTLSVNALACSSDFDQVLQARQRDEIRRMLLDSQYRCEHAYTHAAPGGWGWTALPGGVPDADDTAGALIALHNIGGVDEVVVKAAVAGIEWLLGLQNHDGGFPTFCRGWTNLPFDRSAPDLTAHALAAFGVWQDSLPVPTQRLTSRAIKSGLDYLNRVQRPDGSWVPLWFGNQDAENQENPVYGTARVILGLNRLPAGYVCEYMAMLVRAVEWLLSARNADGGWGGGQGVESSIEETALAVDALAESLATLSDEAACRAASGLSNGTRYLLMRTETGISLAPSPIGLYFAKLWYFEDLYPLIFTVSALQKVKNLSRAV